MARNVTIHCPEGEDVFAQLCLTTGDIAECRAALGYLSTWGLASPDHAHVDITINPENKALFAAYRHPDKIDMTERPNFLLAGIWDDRAGKFGFHS